MDPSWDILKIFLWQDETLNPSSGKKSANCWTAWDMASIFYRFYVCIMWSVQNQRINWISSSIDNPFSHFFLILSSSILAQEGVFTSTYGKTATGKSVKTKAMAALGVILVGNEGLPLSRDFLAGNFFFIPPKWPATVQPLRCWGVFHAPQQKKGGSHFNDIVK